MFDVLQSYFYEEVVATSQGIEGEKIRHAIDSMLLGPSMIPPREGR